MFYQKKIFVLFLSITTFIVNQLQSSHHLQMPGPIHFQELLDQLEEQRRIEEQELTSNTARRPNFQDLLDSEMPQEEEPSMIRVDVPNSNPKSTSHSIFDLNISATKFPTVSSWLSAISTLPKNREGADCSKDSGFALCGNKAAQWNELNNVLKSWLNMKANGSLSEKENWMTTVNNNTMPNDNFFNIHTPVNIFQPFAQKIIVPENSIFYTRGDLHGDIYSLAAQLRRLLNEGIIDESFKIINPNHWMIFLGDYVDKGKYGCEVIYTILRLAIANPNNVIAVRGNHEEQNINIRDGFKDEVLAKFNDVNGSIFREINRIYDFLPAVLYIGCQENQILTNYAQCCHGGIEIGYDPKKFLDEQTKQYQLIDKLNGLTNLLSLSYSIENNKHKSNHDYRSEIGIITRQSIYNPTPIVSDQKPKDPLNLGFLWNDFDDKNNQQIAFNTARQTGLIYAKSATIDILDQQSSATSKILWIFRGHQHSCNPLDSMMQGIIASNGIYKLWNPHEATSKRSMTDGIVWTLNVGADSIYGEWLGFNFDTFVIIKTAKNPKEWSLQVFNQQIINPLQQAFNRTISPILDPSFLSSSTEEEEEDAALFQDVFYEDDDEDEKSFTDPNSCKTRI